MRDLILKELSCEDIATVLGGDGGVRASGSRSIVGERNQGQGWSCSSCEALANFNAAAGTASLGLALAPGGQSASLVSGGAAAAGTALHYQFCG